MVTETLKQRLSDNIKIVVEQARRQGRAELADKLENIYEEALDFRSKHAEELRTIDG